MKKRKYKLRKQSSIEMEKILINHAKWLDYNVSKVEGNKCREDALTYKRRENELLAL